MCLPTVPLSLLKLRPLRMLFHIFVTSTCVLENLFPLSAFQNNTEQSVKSLWRKLKCAGPKMLSVTTAVITQTSRKINLLKEAIKMKAELRCPIILEKSLWPFCSQEWYCKICMFQNYSVIWNLIIKKAGTCKIHLWQREEFCVWAPPPPGSPGWGKGFWFLGNICTVAVTKEIIWQPLPQAAPPCHQFYKRAPSQNSC